MNNKYLNKHIVKYNVDAKFIQQFTKYVLVGCVNFALSFLLFIVLFSCLNLNYLVCNFLTWAFGLIITYIINFLWVFKPDQKLNFKSKFLKYFLVYVSSFGINIFVLRILVEACGFHPIVSQLSLLPLVMTINFFGMKFWSLK